MVLNKLLYISTKYQYILQGLSQLLISATSSCKINLVNKGSNTLVINVLLNNNCKNERCSLFQEQLFSCSYSGCTLSSFCFMLTDSKLLSLYTRIIVQWPICVLFMFAPIYLCTILLGWFYYVTY